MDKLKELYNSYIEQGLISKETTFEQFSSANDGIKNKLYDQGVENNIISNITDFDAFKSAWVNQESPDTVNKETAKIQDSASVDPAVESENTGSSSADGSLEFKVSNQQALLNYKKRTGKEAGSIMDLSDEDYETPLDKFKPVDYNKVVVDGRKKIKNYADERVKLAKKLEIFSYDQFGATNKAVDYVKQGLKSFDKKVDNEVKNLELNDEFKLRNDALNQLIKDTGNTQATGEAVKDVGSEFNVLNVFRGASYYKDIEADEVISLNDEVEQSVLDKLDKRSLQKLAGGFYTLQEKENLINESKSSIIDTRIKTYKDNLDKATFNVESKLDNNKKKLKELESFINPLENREDLTQEEANSYNDAVNQYNGILAESKDIVKEYNEYKTIETQKVESLEGEVGFDVANGVLKNNFKLTDKVEKFREKYSGEGFWNGAADILGGEVLQGFYQTMKKATVGSVTWAMANSADLLTDQDSYSAYDAFSDVINNWSNKTLVPKSTSEEFDITKKEGGFKDFSARNYAKLGASMVPFTGYLISEVRKGKYNNIKQAIGDTYLKLGNKGKVLKDASQTLKNNIIMTDATFRATILDNQKEAEAKGFNGLKANSYATTVSATEAMVQMIMPDTQFLKGVKGKAILDNFTGSLKKAANKQAVISAGKEFTTNVLKEYGEEEINAFANMITDASYGLALPKTSDFLNEQIQLTAGTLMLSGSMGSVGAAKTYSNQKKLVYNQIHKNINSLNTHLAEIAKKSKNTEVKDDVVKAMKFAKDVSQAVESSPENVTSDQIDLLIKKKNLIDKKSKTDKSFHAAIDKSINEINEKIEAGSIRENVRNKFDTDIKNISKSLNSSGTRVDETIVFEDSDGRTAAEKMKEKLLELGKSEEFAEANKNSYGAFIVDKNGKELLIVNKEAAVANSVVSTGQHEFLHKLLRSRFKNKPEELKIAANLLKEEVESINKKTGQGFDFINRLKTYEEDLAKGNLNESGYYEEVFTLFSEALSSKDIKINKSTIGKIGDFIRQSFQNAGFKKIKFNNADDVKNFIIDYNKAYSKGKVKGSLAGRTKSFAIGSSISFSKSVEDIQSEIVALEDLYDEQRIDYYEYEGKMDALEAQLEQAKKAPKEKPKTTKAVAKVNVSDIEEQIDALNNDFYDGVIDEIEHEQKLDILEKKLNQAKLQVSKPKLDTPEKAKKSTQSSTQDIKDQIEQLDEDLYSGAVDDIEYGQRLDLLEEKLKQVELKATSTKKSNKKLGNEIKALIPEGTSKSEYDKKVIGDVYKKLVKGKTLDGLINNQLNRYGVVSDNVHGKPRNMFLKDVKAQLYMNSLLRFNPEINDDLGGFVVNELIKYRIGDVVNRYRKEAGLEGKSLDAADGEVGYAGQIADDSMSIEDKIDLDAKNSAEMGLPASNLIDVTTFKKVKDRIEDIEKSIDLTDVDVANLTYGKIQDEYASDVGAELLGLWDKNAKPEEGQDKNDFQKLSDKIKGGRTLNYGKDTGGEAEVRAMQSLFLDYSDVVKFIKTMPEFNVAPFETTIDKQGRSVKLTEDAKGYSTGTANKTLKKFYDVYIDPKATSKDKDVKETAITSPSGRGKGKTSQVAKVYRLKPEYRGRISRQTVLDLQKTIGITPAGEAFIPMKKEKRTEFGTVLQGLTKMYATNVANTVIRKKIVDEGIKSKTKPTEKVLADIGGGKSKVMFSRAADLGLDVSFETPQLGNVLFSKKARAEYESVLRNKRPDLENPREQVDKLIKWGDALSVKENKKAKYKKLALYYMANGQVIMPEDGYKVVEAVRLGEANKVDPYSVKNPNELIEKYQAKTKGVRINPDKVKAFSNKKVLGEGVTVYDVENSKAGQLAVRKAVDTNWGYKADPWCLVARQAQEQRSEYDFFSTKEQAQAQKKSFEATGEFESVKIEEFEHNLGDGNTETRFIVQAVRPLEKNFDELSGAFGMWKGYNKEGNGFKIAFQDNKLLSFRDGNKLEWWDRQDKPSNKIKLKDKRLSNESVVEEFINPETGKKERGKTIKTYTEDGNAKVKEIYDVDGNLEEKTYKQEVEEDIFLSINEKFSAEGNERTFAVQNDTNNTIKKVSKFVDKRTGETKITTNVRGEKYHEYTRQVEKDGIVRTEMETIRSLDNNETIYNAEIYKGEFKVDINKLESTDFESYTDLDEWFENENKEEANVLFSSAVEIVTEERYKGPLHNLKVNGTEKQFRASLKKNLKEYEWLMKNTLIPALPASHYINKETTETDESKFGTDQGKIEWTRRDIARKEFRKLNAKYEKGKFTSKQPPKLYGREEPEIESNLLNGNIAKFNKNNGKRWELIWTEIFRAARENKRTIPLLTNLVKSSSYKTNHWHRLGAEFIGVEKGVKLDEAYQRYFDYEHALQANQAAFVLWKEALDLAYNESISYQQAEAIFKDKLEEVRENYKLIALGVESHRRVNKFYGKKMPEGWKGWNERYFNALVASIDGGINPDNIVFFNEEQNGWGKTAREVFNVNADGTVSFSKGRLDAEFNKIIENKTGILATDEISEVKAKMIADSKRRFNIFIPPSAEDFVGLLYATLGKGEVGEKQMMFYDRTLIRPYARAMQAITRDRLDLGRAFNNIRKEFKATPKDLKNKVPNSLFTKEQAVRIYIWDSIGKEVPGLNVEETNELANYVADNKQLKDFADQVMRLNPGSKYASPGETWATGTITTDLLETLNESRRAKHLGRWQQNVDEMFSKENLNKLEAAYGTSYRKAMENILTRMKTGRNRTYGTDSQTAKWIDWTNGSVGAIMFLNARSAVLQTISSANFINFGDNNIIAAGKAFANQKQYWTDFAKLINSDYLLERRDSLKINVNEADIAEAASKNGARGAINYILKLGFTPTKFADSFAIASGGAAFYRNRIKSLIKSGMDPVAAEKAAMRDFIEKSEESQQSSRPDKISQEQAGPLGRVILAFANTPGQYARIIKKAALDLKNRRGSDKENISKILYYGVAQNLIFNALQQAIFAVAFGDEEDEGLLNDKELNVVNGMLDGIIRGTGVAGAVFSVVKNTGIKIYKEANKKRPNYEKMVDEALKISPPISSKISKLKSAGRTFTWDAKEIKGKGLDITNPAIGASAKIVSATTNLPLDRVVRKIENLKAASDSELETYKRLALVLGWGKWELGIKDKKWKDPNAKPKSKSRVIQRKVLQRKLIKR